MPTFPNSFRSVRRVAQTVMMLATQVWCWVRLRLRSRMALAAENLFLQKQLALYHARNAPSRHHMNATRLTLVWLSYWFDWQPALTIVRPETFKRWRRQGWRLLWKTTSKPLGRPPIPPELQALIRRMARENLTWGQQLALFQVYHNFVLPHASLRQPLPLPEATNGSGSARAWRPRTPAMAAGLTDHVWALREVLLYRVPPGPQPQAV